MTAATTWPIMVVDHRFWMQRSSDSLTVCSDSLGIDFDCPPNVLPLFFADLDNGEIYEYNVVLSYHDMHLYVLYERRGHSEKTRHLNVLRAKDTPDTRDKYR